jgi:fructose-1-phosphate kinase PfkB-like protein
MATTVTAQDIEALETQIKDERKQLDRMIAQGCPSQAMEDALADLYKRLQEMKERQRRTWTEDHG